MQSFIRLAGIGEARYPLGRPGDRCNHSLYDHFIESVLYLLPVLNRTLFLGVLDRDNIRVSPDGIGPRHIAYGIEGVWEGLLQGNYVLDHGGRSRGSHLSQLHLEGWLRFGIGSTGNTVLKGW